MEKPHVMVYVKSSTVNTSVLMKAVMKNPNYSENSSWDHMVLFHVYSSAVEINVVQISVIISHLLCLGS